MTPQDIIDRARHILQDTDVDTPRQEDAELLNYVNDGLREMVDLNPILFSTIGDLLCTQGQCEQTILFDDAAMLIEVICIHEGAALTPFVITTMNAFNPNWRTDTAGDARQWARFPDNPLKFFIYPKAPATSQTIDVRYARVPSVYALTDDIEDVPVSKQTALIDYVVHRAEAKDDEHVLSQRSAQFYASFVSKVKG